MSLRTPSLRRRVTVSVLALIAAMLVVLAVVTDVVLTSRLDGQLRTRLVDRAAVASALSGQVDARDLARRLEGDGISVVLTTAGGEVYGEGPLGGGSPGTSSPEPAATVEAAGRARAGRPAPGPKATVVQQGDRLSVTRTLDDGDRVTLLADATDVHRTLVQVRLALVLAAGLVLLGAAAVVPPVVSRTLRPLDRITEVARSIGSGDRARRLRPRQPRTELGRTAVAFDDMLDAVVGAESRAVASEHRLRDFLSDAAHELRTPVAGVQAAAEHLLRDDPPRAEREQAVLGLVRESRRAGRLVDDLLTMARIDSGLALEPREVDLHALATEVARSQSLQHPGTEVRVHGSPACVPGDPDRLTQVIGNLVTNAVHAAGAGGRVDVHVEADENDAAVTVTDDGPGVPEADRDRVFERLVRLDPGRRDRPTGAGLGLSIARGLARAHGGELVCFAPGEGRRGAVFRLRLPR